MRLSSSIITIISIFTFGLFLYVPAAGAAATTMMPIYTASAGGPGYMIGAGIASIISKNVPGIQLVAEATTGSAVMVKNLKEKEEAKKPALAMISSDMGYNAFYGKKIFEGKEYKGLRWITHIFGGPQFLTVMANSSIKSYADLKGKRIAIGAPGSTVAESTLALLELYGITQKDFKPYFFSYQEGSNGVKDGSLDACMLAEAEFIEMTVTQNVRALVPDEEILKKLQKQYPYYPYVVIKAGTYKGMTQNTPAITFIVAVLTHEGIDTDTIYRITKNLYEHSNELYEVHKFARQMTPETALLGMSVPIHPGAEKYYKEAGIMKK